MKWRIVAFALFVMIPSIASAASSVQAVFDLSTTYGKYTAPFPSDRFTVKDPTQNTQKRVSMPYPPTVNCTPQPPTDPACFLTYTTNFLDGFNVQPRLSIPFSGPIDPNTVSSKDVFLVYLGSTLPGGPKPGQIVGINQIVWEVAANTLHAESDDLLEQHAFYALVVTDGIHDANGSPVQPSNAFTNFPGTLLKSSDPALRAYGLELSVGLAAALLVAKVSPKDVVAASMFTTESVTATLEKIRDQIKSTRPAPANFKIGPGGSSAVFNLSDVSLVTFNLQFGADPNNPGSFFPNDTFIEALSSSFPVGQVAFGRFSSPSYLNSDIVIPPVGTLTGNPAVQATNQIYFDLVTPPGPKPKNGWPVAIYGHGAGGSKDLDVIDIAGQNSEHGVATILINAAGQGYGPASTITVQKTDKTVVTIPAPGRGADLDNDGFITQGDGGVAIGANEPGDRDSRRQTVADWMQLVREVQVGMDIDGDGKPDLDPSRIYHAGLSLGAIEGTMFDAVEPAVHSVVIDAGGGPAIDLLRLSPFFNPSYVSILGAQTPSLLNGPNGTYIDNTPLRNQPPVINNTPGAEAIQNFDDFAGWLEQPGEPVPYAQHLRKEPLRGISPKSVIVEFGRGDKELVNPLETAVVRAGDLNDRTTYFRTDILDAIDHSLASGGASGLFPHIFLIDFGDDDLSYQIAIDAGEEIAQFFAADGTKIVSPQVIDPTLPPGLFEVPIAGPLPEDLNFIF